MTVAIEALLYLSPAIVVLGWILWSDRWRRP